MKYKERDKEEMEVEVMEGASNEWVPLPFFFLCMLHSFSSLLFFMPSFSLCL